MKKILARLPRPLFLLLLASHITYFLGQLFFAQAKVRSVTVLLLAVVMLVGLSALGHFIPPTEPLQWPTNSTATQQVSFTRPQLAGAIEVWQHVYSQQPRSETVALTLLSLCQASGNHNCIDQATQTILDLNPALLSPRPNN